MKMGGSEKGESVFSARLEIRPSAREREERDDEDGWIDRMVQTEKEEGFPFRDECQKAALESRFLFQKVVLYSEHP